MKTAQINYNINGNAALKHSDMSADSQLRDNLINIYTRELGEYRQLNTVARKNGTVLFGSSFAKNIPVCELKQAFELDCDIYNRSFDDLSIFDAYELLDECIIKLCPSKVLLQLGESDLERGSRSIPEMMAEYKRIIEKIKVSDKRCKITLVSVCNNGSELHPGEFNRQLEALAAETGCAFADISPAFSNDSPSVKAFSLLRRYFRDRLTNYDALNY